MTSPAVFSTPLRIINQAYLDSGLSQLGSPLNGEQIVDATNRLNDIINFEQTQGLKLWTQVDYPITLTSGVNLYPLTSTSPNLTAKPLRVLQAYYLDTNNIQRPLICLSRDEWTRLSTLVQIGAVNSYFIDKQQFALNVYLWLVPDSTAATGTVHVVLQEQINNFQGLTETMNFPPEWGLWLRWALADDLSTGQPDAIVARCSSRAAALREALEAWDVEDAATMFTPDQRVQYVSASFY
jgi:hypothetical protein